MSDARAILLALARDPRYPDGPCWCEMAIGSPLVRKHSAACLAARAFVALPESQVVRVAHCGECPLSQSNADWAVCDHPDAMDTAPAQDGDEEDRGTRCDVDAFAHPWGSRVVGRPEWCPLVTGGPITVEASP